MSNVHTDAQSRSSTNSAHDSMHKQRIRIPAQAGTHLVEPSHNHSHAAHRHDGEAHDHLHPHPHAHGQTHSHDHGDHAHSWWQSVAQALHLPGYAHTHDHGALAATISAADNQLAIRTVWLALLALGLTTVLQIGIYLASGSVALLADTVHNLGDALNSVPLLVAFYLARRAANRRYTYGYHRAEDVAGIFIVLSIAFSAGYILWESVNKLIHPQPLDNLPWVAAAAVIGFIGNELVALLQIRVGERIGSAAMVADGLHARTDGITSLAVLVAVAGAALGYPLVDPIVGLVIGVIILFITRDAIVTMWRRMMDAVDPALIDQAEAIIHEHGEVKGVPKLQMRWLGHQLHAEVEVELEPTLSLAAGETIADHIRHHLHHALPRLADATVAAVPWREQRRDSAHHRT